MGTALQFDAPAGQARDTTQWLWLQRLAAPTPPLSALIVAAHPGDEVIGAGARLAHLRNRVLIVHVTDGAPGDLENAGFAPTPEDADARRRELHAALGLAGIGTESTLSLGVPDTRAAFTLVLLVRALATLVAAMQPDIVLTHPFEGGHPDHDATAYAVQRAMKAARRLGAAPVLVEFTSYHAGAGGLEPGFLPTPRPVPAITVPLDRRERALKDAMLGCFASGAETPQAFGGDEERFRIAPAYDFRARPHDGRLWYEARWGVPWPTWSRLVEEADVAIASEPENRCG